MSVTVHKISQPHVSRKCGACNENVAVLEAEGHLYCQHCWNFTVNIAWALAKEDPEFPSDAPTEAEDRAAWLETVSPDFDLTVALEQDEIDAGPLALGLE